MKRTIIALGLSLLVAPAFAQLQPPDPATLQSAISAIKSQREQAFDLAASWEVRARSFAADLDKANARIKDLEPKEAELAKAQARIKELESDAPPAAPKE